MTFSHTPEEALVEDRAEACIEKKINSVIEKIGPLYHLYKLTVPYKIDTGSDGNIMPWYIFKKLFPRVIEAKLKKH